MSISSRGLWRHPQFRILWAGQATSMLGSLVGVFALDWVAILTLNASPGQIALLNGCSLLPGMVVAPWAGTLVDRVRHKPLLVAADILRALLIASIPIAAVTHTLSFPQLCAVAATVSVVRLTFDVSFRAYLPSFVGEHRLVEANSLLQGTNAVAEMAGWSVAGVLVQLLSAPITVAVDSVSFLLSALSFAAIRGPDARATKAGGDESGLPSRAELLEGVRCLWNDRVLRAVTFSTVLLELVGNTIGVVIVLFFIRELHVGAALLGPIIGLGGISSLLGAVFCTRVVRRWGLRGALIGALCFGEIGLFPVVLAGGPILLIVLLLCLGQTTDAGRSIYEINVTSLLQTHASQAVAGRVFAAYEALKSMALCGGLVLGGILGSSIGLRPTLFVTLAASTLAPLSLALSPVRRMRGASVRISSQDSDGLPSPVAVASR
jgi:MFS family permease